jgi:ribosomal protein S18 acetylase RimI-like enzyme
MAARFHTVPAGPPGVVDLRRLTARDLDPLLEEETGAWHSELEWDFSRSADLVRHFVELRSLNGSALIEDGEVVGYAYYVMEENKALIGDLYVRRASRTLDRENLLLVSALEPVMAHSAIARVESQLMMLGLEPGKAAPYGACLNVYERNFMRLDLGGAPLAEGRVRYPVYLERWTEHYQDAAAQGITSAYLGHVDSLINDQYRSAWGARRFLRNITQYPGCGAFYRPASYVALEARNGRLCGISLASMVAEGSGHITQICVSPAVRGTGVGHILLRHSLLALREAGCRSVSLTVTAANEDAVALYERVGFRTLRQFCAYVWEGFQGE